MTRTCSRILLAALAAAAFSGCASRPAVVPTPVEQQLLDGMTRDPFVRIESMVREEDGFLLVRTGQGDATCYYRLMPAGDGKDDLVLRRVDERQELPVAWTDEIGTGPARRGLAR